MQSSKISLIYFVPIVLIFFVLGHCNGEDTACTINDFPGCGANAMCVQKVSGVEMGVCQCLPGFGRTAGVCVQAPNTDPPAGKNVPTSEPHTDHSSKNAVVASVLVPLLLIAAVVTGLVYVGRRYNWLHKLRQLRPLQRTNDVLIGRPDDDDDPIA